jgi:hypothetical protein
MNVWTYKDVAVVTADDREHAVEMLELRLGIEVDPGDVEQVDQTHGTVLMLRDRNLEGIES